MRTILFAMAATVAIGFSATTSTSAAPVNGAVIETAAQAVQVTEQVHCRRYPHRHRHAIPHGFGFGCKR
jgi:hypothetical protein